MMITSRVFAFIYFCIVFFFTDSHNRPESTRLMYRKYYLSFQNGVVCFPLLKWVCIFYRPHRGFHSKTPVLPVELKTRTIVQVSRYFYVQFFFNHNWNVSKGHFLISCIVVVTLFWLWTRGLPIY